MWAKKKIIHQRSWFTNQKFAIGILRCQQQQDSILWKFRSNLFENRLNFATSQSDGIFSFKMSVILRKKVVNFVLSAELKHKKLLLHQLVSGPKIWVSWFNQFDEKIGPQIWEDQAYAFWHWKQQLLRSKLFFSALRLSHCKSWVSWGNNHYCIIFIWHPVSYVLWHSFCK